MTSSTFAWIACWEHSSEMEVPMVPHGQAVFASVFKVAPKVHARNVSGAPTRIQFELDKLNRSPHPLPFRKPFLESAVGGTFLLAIENVHLTQADADSNSLNWAWQDRS
jgi:hypothetical protein